MSTVGLLDLLCQERDTLKTLLGILSEEQVLLLRARIEDLPTVTQKKLSALTRLSALANCREQSFSAGGFAPPERGVRTWLDQHPVPRMAEVWAEVCSMLPLARELNRLNGMLISKRLYLSQQSLSLLGCGRQGDMDYGADGQPKHLPASHKREVIS